MAVRAMHLSLNGQHGIGCANNFSFPVVMQDLTPASLELIHHL